jgi:VWFA-related protein
MARFYRLCAMLLVLFVGALLAAQSQPQALPDAPQPQQPKITPAPPGVPPPPDESSSHDTPAPVERSADKPADDANAPPPAPLPDVPSRPAIPAQTPDRQRLYSIGVSVNFIQIPVTVKDPNGGMVPGLLPKDFTVYENGVRQKLSYFTSDPLPISAAVLIDTSMSDLALSKVKAGIQALQGAFSQYDNVAIYTYGSSVTKESDFNGINERLSEALNRVVVNKHGSDSGVPVGGGPFNAGPSVNGHPIDPGAPQTPIIPRSRRVLNDAILRAALDLQHVTPDRRRVILVIGDGTEDGSTASYSDVLKILLANNVSLYAIAVDGGAIPVYRRLEQIGLPRQGKGNILPKYANATGGEVFPEFTRANIEKAYASVTDVARNQYTLGYYTQATLSENCRDLEVRVDRPSLRISSKAQYCPLPARR